MAQKFPSEELRCGSVIEPLPDIHKGPGSIPGTTGGKKKDRSRKDVRLEQRAPVSGAG